MNLRVMIMLAGVGAAVWSFRRWREAVQLAMVLVIFEGAIRKWVFPGAQDLIYFAKDVLLLGAYAGFARDLAELDPRGVLQLHQEPDERIVHGCLAHAESPPRMNTVA